ncbi:MAG: amino acid aminotransferase [Planctomycetota bacterium]|jgi:aromatic-amino-acid transaminase
MNVNSAPSLFEHVASAPPDPVFGLMDLYRQDKRTDKINLTVGAYQTEAGQTPVLASVKTAERFLLEQEQTKNYLPIDGSPRYNRLVAELVFGADCAALEAGRIVTAHTPGGTGALRIAGDLLRRAMGCKTIWMGTPTWANHPQIYAAAQLELQQFPYLHPHGIGVNFEEILRRLAHAERGQALLLHTVCHNPTGFDLTPVQWEQLLDLVLEKQLIPIFDFAYQGFHRGLEEDAAPIRRYIAAGGEALVCGSFSKNFGLYAERCGSLSVVTKSADAAGRIQSQIKSIIRTIYSTPAKHGSSIVETILGTPELRRQWESELSEMRERIAELRLKLADGLKRTTSKQDFSFMTGQIGMFSFSGLTAKQAVRLRDEFGIYIVESGRINVAGLNSANLPRVCEAIAAVL